MTMGTVDTTARHLRLLTETIAAVSSSLDLQEVLELVASKVAGALGTDACFVYLYDEPANELVLRATHGSRVDEMTRTPRMRPGEGITGAAAAERAPVMISAQAHLDPRFKLFANLPEDEYESILAVPILARDKLEGALNVRTREPRAFTGDEVELLVAIASQVAQTIEHAKLYAAALGPGFLLAGLYIAYTLIRSYLNPSIGPAVPPEERATSMAMLVREVVVGVLPLALLISCTLGSILGGLATPTEAASVGASGAMVLGFAYRRLTFRGIKQAAISTLITSSMVLFLAVASNVFGAVFARLGSATWITEGMLALPLPPPVMLIVVVVLIFLLGWPFEWPAIVLVFLPIFYPVMEALRPALGVALGVPPDFVMIWFGALVAVTLQTAFLSPPVAMSAYYLRQVVKDWSLATIYKGMFEFMLLQCIAIALIIVFPAITTMLPEQLRKEARETQVEQVDDSMNRLEEDPLKGLRR